MKTVRMYRVLATFLGMALLTACQLDPLNDNLKKEEYTKAFIKEFGLIDPNQDWNQANSAYVSVNLGETVEPQVKIYTSYGSKYYLVADLENVKGKIDVPVDVPKGSSDVKVKIGSREYYGKINTVIDCSQMSRGVPGVTYGHDDSGDYTNPNPAVYEKSKTVGTTTYAVKVQHTTRGNGAERGFTDNGEYKYFNTQQMAPIVSTEKWDRYYSLNKLIWVDNPTADETSQSSWGILPERGVFNVPASKLTNWLADKRREGKNIVEDFTIETGTDGSLTLFPYYYGTNLQHELGIYLIDENDNPILANGNTYNAANAASYTLDDFVSFPVFQNRQHGDLQVKHQFDGRIKGIRLKDGKTSINLVVGETKDIGDLVQVNLKENDSANDNWVDYNTYIADNATTSHSRLAVHVWDNEKNDWVKFENYHTLKTLKTGNASGLIGIATGMTNTESGKGKTIGYVATVNYTFSNERAKEYTLTSDIPSKVVLEVGETKVYHITSLKEVGNDQDIWDSTNNIKVTDQWYANDMDLTLDKSARTLTIKAKKACTEEDQRNPRIYIDEDNSGNCDNGEIELKEFNVVITGSSTPEYVLTSDIPSKVELEVGETVTYNITSLKISGQDQDVWDSTDYIKVSDTWYPDYMDLTLDKTNRTLTIKAKKACVETDYRNPIIYIDNNNNGYWDSGDTELKKFLVVISEASTPSTTSVQHSYSQTYTAWPLSSPTWQSFFHDSNAPVSEFTLFTGNESRQDNTPFGITNDQMSGATDQHNLVIAIAFKCTCGNAEPHTEGTITFKTTWGTEDLPGITTTQTIDTNTTSITIPLSTELAALLKQQGLNIWPTSEGFTITSVKLVPKNPTSGTEDPVWTWNSDGMTSAASALVTHYSNSANYPSGNVNCALHSDEQISFTGENISVGTPSVTIDVDADYTTVKYTVTWPVTETVAQSSGAPRHKAPSRRLNKSYSRLYTSPAPRRAASRDVEAGRPAMLQDDIAAEWSDVNSYWTPVLPQTQEVASYPPNMTMLGRSRGYDFTITVNGQPYNGKVGVYMKVLGDNHLATNGNPDWNTLANNDNGYYEGVNPSSNETKTYNDVTFPYVVFSQKRFNKDATGAASDQIASLVFKHPTNPENTYMTFEDMLLTNSSHKKVGNRESSDRDVNDLIFNITNYKSVGGGGSNLTEHDEDDEGFPWIWALEDLGATDDFDFNDLVVKVSCITKMHTTQKDGVDVSGTATKKLTFTPLCAGGTLPLYIHFKMGGVDYILKPGSYNLSGVPISGVTTTGDDLRSYSTEAEVHHWFGGGYNSSIMINTGAGVTVSPSNINSCSIYVPAPTFNTDEHKFNNDGFNLNIFSSASASGTTIDNTANLEKTAHFLASVSQNTNQSEIGDERLVEEYNIVNDELGAAPQSFIIMAPDWRWPRERHHILDAYPDFGQWVKNKANNTWHAAGNSAHLY